MPEEFEAFVALVAKMGGDCMGAAHKLQAPATSVLFIPRFELQSSWSSSALFTTAECDVGLGLIRLSFRYPSKTLSGPCGIKAHSSALIQHQM